MSIAEIFDSMAYGPAPESRAEVDRWLEQRQKRFGCFIGGQWTPIDDKTLFTSRNPATGETLARLTQATQSQVDSAVAAARRAQPAWEALGGHGRARHLYALARLVQKHSRRLAVLESLDNGKPLRESRDGDLPLVARHFYHHAGWAQLQAQELPGYRPLGVAGQIIPWNFPLLMLAWKAAPALAMGNCVVLKPAEYTSLSALAFAELSQQAGLPAGVFNLITGDGRVGEALAGHRDINKLAFTGSTEVGRRLRQATAGSGKKLTLELGGKSPSIVFDDADLDSTVEGVVDAIWFNQGQVCCAGSRLLLQEGIAVRFLDKLKQRMTRLRVGDPLDKAIDMGAIVDPAQQQRIGQLVDLAIEEGAELWQPEDCPRQGCFYPPTLLTEVSPASTAAQEEIFGPVLVAMTFRTPDEAVSMANNSRYGLAASVWTENINLALDQAPKLKAGVVWINCTNQFDAACEFGGYRESGFGREGGKDGLYEYLTPDFDSDLPHYAPPASPPAATPDNGAIPGKAETATEKAGAPLGLPQLDRTAKLYIGGKQTRPDGGYPRPVLAASGRLLGEVGEGNRKDIRNAVEAARKADGWAQVSGHGRAQILYYLAENLSARAAEFADRLSSMTGAKLKDSQQEVAASIQRLFSYGAWADKFDGAVHNPPLRGVALAMNEPLGIIGQLCPDDRPLLGLISLMAPAIATGNRVVLVPSPPHPLSATDLYQVFDTSDLPAGVVNIVTGDRDALATTLAEHDEVAGLWYVGPKVGSTLVERASTGNLKRCWVNYGKRRDWFDPRQGEGREFLRQATQVKNIWVPYGE